MRIAMAVVALLSAGCARGTLETGEASRLAQAQAPPAWTVAIDPARVRIAHAEGRDYGCGWADVVEGAAPARRLRFLVAVAEGESSVAWEETAAQAASAGFEAHWERYCDRWPLW